ERDPGRARPVPAGPGDLDPPGTRPRPRPPTAGRGRPGAGAGGADGAARGGRQGGHRPGRRRDRPGHRPARPRSRAARGGAGGGQDAARAGRRRLAVARHQARAVHPRPDAGRHHRLAGLRQRRLLLPGRAGLHQPAAGRRDQPHPAQDPGLAARGHGGAAGHGRRHAASAARPLRRVRDAEPGRVRRHLPAAGGPARPLPAQAQRGAALARRRGAGAGRARPGLRPARPRRSRPAAGRRSRRAGRRARRGPCRLGGAGGPRLRRRPVPGHPQQPVALARRLAARRDRPAGHGQGLGVAVLARLRHTGRRQGPRAADAAPPPGRTARGRARGRHRRRRARRRARLGPRPPV
ncbi:MAG: FIG022979: MoxR-like ATPases, partial [uncultured Frankineae bacterium]